MNMSMSSSASDIFHPAMSSDDGQYGERLRQELEGITIAQTSSDADDELQEQSGNDS